jgi:hypothetical protein
MEKSKNSLSRSYSVGSSSRNFLIKLFNKSQEADNIELEEVLHINQDNIELEEVLHINQDIDNFRTNIFTILKPELLYKKKTYLKDTSLYRHVSERRIMCREREKVILDFMITYTKKELLKINKRLVHIWLYLIEIKGTGRTETDSKVLMALYDSRWGTNMTKTLIAMAEIDMNEDIGLLYCMPDMILEIRYFCKYIKVGI